MSTEMSQTFFGWCALINIGLLAWWFLMFWLAHDWIYHFHGRLFKISVENFDTIHYSGMAVYKVGLFLLNFVPHLALAIMQ